MLTVTNEPVCPVCGTHYTPEDERLGYCTTCAERDMLRLGKDIGQAIAAALTKESRHETE